MIDLDFEALILRYLQGRLPPREEERLRKWRQSDPEHERRYQEFAAIWRVTGEREQGVKSSPPSMSTIKARAGLRGERRSRWKRRLWYAAGAAAAFVAGLSLAVLPEDPTGSADAGTGEVITGPEEVVSMRLVDGTMVRLAPESRLVIPTAAERRKVILDGKAFFAVAKDSEDPFMVRTPSGEARVLGTRFELEARPGHLRLLVVDGRVALSSGATEVSVGPRQITHLRWGQEPSTVEVDDVWPFLGWMGAFLAFESTPMSEVRMELERRFGLTLAFEDPTLGDETVTVWFRDEPIEEVVSVLCRLLEAECAIADSRVRISRIR